MADKPDKKGGDKKSGGGGRPVDLIIAEVVILLLILGGGLTFLINWLNIEFSGEAFRIGILGILSSIQAIAAFISLLFVMGIIYAKFKIGQIKRARKLEAKIKKVTENKVVEAKKTENKKWVKVKEHASSANPSDWRLAILEADILLGDLLTKLGYKGEGIGEQLKSVERIDFQTLDLAWEAHKIRNSIAHEGSDFVLSPNEAKRVIGLFEEVFKEFRYI